MGLTKPAFIVIYQIFVDDFRLGALELNANNLYLRFSDCPAARPRSERPPTATTAAGVAAAAAAGVAAARAGPPATGLPVIFYAGVIHFRSIRSCIPLIGSTTWTTFTTTSRPPRTVPTPRYTVIIIRIYANREVGSHRPSTRPSVTGCESTLEPVKGTTRISAGSVSSSRRSVQKLLESDPSRVICCRAVKRRLTSLWNESRRRPFRLPRPICRCYIY